MLKARFLKRFFRRSRLVPGLFLFGSLVLVSTYNACSKTNFAATSISSTGAQNSLGAPSLQINGGAKYTQSTSVQLQLNAPGAQEMYVTNTRDCTGGGTWETFAPALAWTLGVMNQETSVFAKFRNGTTETSCVSANIIHDNVPPAIVVDTAVPVFTTINNVTINFHANDAVSGVNQMFCILPGQSSALPCQGIYSGTQLPDGPYVVQFAASDNAGNVSLPVAWGFGVDTTPPVVTINSAPASISGVRSASFGFTAVDNFSGVQKFQCKLDQQAAYSDCTSPQLYDNLVDGSHTFAVHASDVAGNVSADVTYTWTVDATVPTVMFTKTPPPFSNSSMAEFDFTGMDALNKPLASYQCRLDGGAFAACSSPDTLANLVEGTHTFGVRGQSVAGIYSAEIDYTWLVDLTPPAIALTKTPNVLTNSNAATFAFTVTDQGSGVAAVVCSLDGGAPQDCASLLVQYSNLKGDTQHYFQITATDFAGNQAQSTPYQWYIDNTPPTVMITSMPAALSPSSGATFQFSGMDDHSPTVTFQCALDNSGLFSACTSPANYQGLADGSHTFYVQSIDGAGNMSAIASYSWIIDSVGPSIAFTQVPASTITVNDQGVLTYAITDSHATITSETCLLDTTNLNCTQVTATLTFPKLAAGTHTFMLTATNSLGLSSSKSYSFTVRNLNCTTTLSQTTIPTKMMFVVDISGSNQSYPGCPISASCTDPGKTVRAGSIQQFFNDYGAYMNFFWGFITFHNTSAQALINNGNANSAIYSNAPAMQSAITAFESITDSGGTPYMSALNLATTAISTDSDLNNANKPQYITVFLSDGQPDGAGDTTTNILNQVQTLVNLAPGRITFNTVYYGPVNATASNLLQSMANTGGGKFLNTNTNPTGRDFQITDVINVPVTTCN